MTAYEMIRGEMEDAEVSFMGTGSLEDFWRFAFWSARFTSLTIRDAEMEVTK